MKILMVSRSTIYHIKGGMEYYTDTLVKELRKRGHEVLLLSTSLPSGKKVRGVVTVPNTKPGSYSIEWWKQSAKAGEKIIGDFEPDLVHSQSIAAFGMADSLRKRGIPLVATIHGTPEGDLRGEIGSWGSKNLRDNILGLGGNLMAFGKHLSFYKKCAKLIAVSPGVMERLRGFYGRENTVLINNGVDTARFRPADAQKKRVYRKRLGLEEDNIIGLYVGRLTAIKGAPILLDSVKDLNMGLLIAGSGDLLEEMRDRTAGLNNVHLLGFIHDRDLPYYYAASDIFIMPTMHFEGLSISLLQAIASGLPVVATDIGGNRYLVRENGILVRPGKAEDIRRALETLISDKNKRIMMGVASRELAMKEYSLKTMVDRTEEIYREVGK